MFTYLTEYSVVALALYIAIGFVLLSLATVFQASECMKARIPATSASATAISLACSWFVIQP